MPWISTKILEKPYYYFDSNNKNPILLDIHGFGVTAKTHYSNASFPFENKCRLIIPELPGHGELVNMEIKSIGNISKYLTNLIDYLLPSTSKFSIIGRSIGGTITLDLLNNYKLRNRVDSIFIVETPVLSYKKAFTKKFRTLEFILPYLPLQFVKNIFNSTNANSCFGLKIFLEQTRHQEILNLIKSIDSNLEIDQLKTNINFIYSLKDLYLTDDNINYLKKMNQKVYINPMVGHFKNSTHASVVNFIFSRLEKG